MIVDRTFDQLLVWQLMTQPEMWATVAEDGHQPMDYLPDVQGEAWLLMYGEGEVYGVYRVHAMNSVTCEIHAQVVPKHRNEHALETGRLALKWIYDNAPQYEKVICWVPEIYPNVRGFAEKFGFKLEGTNRDSYLKNGQLHDQWLLGIKRSEIGDLLNEQRS